MSGLEGSIRFEVLGPLRVHADGRDASIRAGRERVVLAMLLLNADRPVAVDQLVEAVWPGGPPPSSRNQIQTCVSQLRRLLAGLGLPDQVIATDPAGYRARVDPRRVDLFQFRELVAEARVAAADGRLGEARDGYRAGLGLWRGPALGGFDSDRVRELAGTLDAEREQALEECVEVELALGGGGELVAELTELVRRYPYRERLHGALMRALYRASRSADALAAFRRARRLFHDELGTEPGEELQRLHQAILNRDPELRAAPAPGLRELPVEASCFVGRDAELVRVRDILAPPDQEVRRRPSVMVLYGPGGTGKSALAVRVAHEVVEQFPDGQLYVDLCGSTPGMRPVPAVEVLGRFLRRLGVHPSEVPSGEAEAAALFRSLTTGRRMLFVLDNAADKDQVAVLVPGTPSCAVLVTSRHPLPTLDADGRLRVEALPDADGLALLAGLTGRLAAEPEAAAEIVALCGGLPLAIRVAAGRLAARPDLTAAEYARRLADRSRRLDELQLDDLAVRASIRTSYDALLADGGPAGQLAARAFRMLGLLHVPDVAPPVVAAMLTEPDVETTRAALDRLVQAQLLEPIAGGRYRLHDLVRLVATERASEEETTSDRDDMVYRAIAFYTGTLWRARRKLRPAQAAPFGEPPMPGQLPMPEFTETQAARDWCDAELAGLMAALEQASALSGPAGGLPLWLSEALWENVETRCDWEAAKRVGHLTVDAAEKRSDSELAAIGFLLLGRSEACLGSYDSAAGYIGQASEVFRQLHNGVGVALTLNGLGIVHTRRHEPDAALMCYSRALDLAAENKLASLTAGLLGNMSVSYAQLGRFDQSVAVAERGAATAAAVSDHTNLATAMINLSAVHCLSGDQVKALQCADEAILLCSEAGDRMRMCEELIIRSEANRRSERLRESLVDAERAHSLARVNGYRYAAAAAELQRSRALAALGRNVEAGHVDARAQKALAALTRAHRDYLLGLLLV